MMAKKKKKEKENSDLFELEFSIIGTREATADV